MTHFIFFGKRSALPSLPAGAPCLCHGGRAGSAGTMDSRVHNLAPGELFEVPIDIKAPSVLKFSFSVLEGGSVEFSVVHKAGGKKSKETMLLPASTYSENIGEVPASASQNPYACVRIPALAPRSKAPCLSCAGPAAGPGRVRRALPQPNRLVLLVPSEGPLRALRRPDALSRRSEAQKAAAAAAAAEVSSRGRGGGSPADRGGGAVCSGGARSRHADAEGAVAGDGRRSLAPAGASALARRGD